MSHTEKKNTCVIIDSLGQKVIVINSKISITLYFRIFFVLSMSQAKRDVKYF